MTTTKAIDISVLALNLKFQMCLGVHLAEETDDVVATEKALADVAKDIKAVEECAGDRIHLDDNYSMTLGFFPYGLYRDLEEVQASQHLVDPGVQ